MGTLLPNTLEQNKRRNVLLLNGLSWAGLVPSRSRFGAPVSCCVPGTVVGFLPASFRASLFLRLEHLLAYLMMMTLWVTKPNTLHYIRALTGTLPCTHFDLVRILQDTRHSERHKQPVRLKANSAFVLFRASDVAFPARLLGGLRTPSLSMAQPVYDSDDDPDLKRAIELSLGASAGATRNNDTIELSSDDGSDLDEDLKRAIALSLGQTSAEDAGKSVQDMKRQDESTPAEETQDEEDDDDDLNKTPVYRPKKNKVPETTSKSDTAQGQQSQEQKAPQTSTFMGMDRKKMEEERLARLSAKRKTPDTGQESQGRESRIRTGPVPQAMSSDQTQGGTVTTGSNAAYSTDTQSRNSSLLPFPKGVVKKTFAKGFPRTDDDITIDEVFQKEHLQLAVLSSFQWDTEWLFNKKIDHKRTNVCLIMFATGEEQVRCQCSFVRT